MLSLSNYFASLLSVSNAFSLNPGNDLLYGGAVVAVGVCAVLAFLGIAKLFKSVFGTGSDRQDNDNASVISAPGENSYYESKADDGEIIAVIAAAIAMAESENSGLKFKVVSFRRV